MLLSCDNTKRLESSFFLAGHTYGDPQKKGSAKGLYEPFMDKVSFIEQQPKMNQGFLLGDMVWLPRFWPESLQDIEKFSIPLHIVRGNHDGPLKAFESKFGKSYRSFIKNDNLFIVLDSNLDKWNISGDQLTFLRNTLRNEGEKAKNIFIMAHHLLWWSNDRLSKPKPNSLANRDETTNFWTTIEPLLRIQNKPVYVFAGDVGAFSKEHRKRDHIIEYFYYNYDNLTFVATGMGGGVRDNMIFVDTYNDGSVEFRLVHLNGDDPYSLGKLEDYKIAR